MNEIICCYLVVLPRLHVFSTWLSHTHNVVLLMCKSFFVSNLQAIYGQLFIWVVDKINTVIYTQHEESDDPQQTISLLDIFGFENFDKNRLISFLLFFFFMFHFVPRRQWNLNLLSISNPPCVSGFVTALNSSASTLPTNSCSSSSSSTCSG